jgi:hypothetical protein
LEEEKIGLKIPAQVRVFLDLRHMSLSNEKRERMPAHSRGQQREMEESTPLL